MNAHHAASSSRKRINRGGIEYRLVYAIGFSVFFVTALTSRAARTLTLRRRNDGRSIVQEAREATGATIPYAFMG